VTTALVLLAAGKGSRLGRDKGLLQMGGESFVERHLRQACLAGIAHAVVVANDTNQSALTELVRNRHPTPRIVLQELAAAEGAIFSGLEAAAAVADEVFLSCVNDIVPDDTYGRLKNALRSISSGMVVASTTLHWPFMGGRLRVDAGRLRYIEERPAGGCLPGDDVNVFMHAFRDRSIVTELLVALRSRQPYESILNDMLTNGLVGLVVKTDKWVGVKAASDLARVEQSFGVRVQ
jgi:molybdopterin-guanine dinucleotide biosynthesis protein A